ARAGHGPSGARPKVTPALMRSALAIARSGARTPLVDGGVRDALRSPLPRAAIETFLDVFANPALRWDDLARLREWTDLPVLLKGVMHPDDATRALDHGADGVVVSNHGGRQIDGAVATLDALPAVAERIGGRAPIILDSGVRGGADAFRALALGATAVGIGRPYAYGLAVAGEAGVREVVRNHIAELDVTMALAGCRSVSEIGPESLRLVA
ncbi:MAG TPA: alpha-hydroxy-acid oxidizing protein, partial [Agromyces sp.]